MASNGFLCLTGRSDKQREGPQKGQIGTRGFCVLLSTTAYICDGPGLNHFLRAEVLKFWYLAQVSPFKKIRAYWWKKLSSLAEILWFLRFLLFSVLHTPRLSIGTFPRRFSETGRAHWSLLVTCWNARAGSFPISGGRITCYGRKPFWQPWLFQASP